MEPSVKIDGIRLWLVLHKAYKAVEQAARDHLDSLDLCLTDFAVMEALMHKGPMRVNELGDKVILTSGSITTAVQRLEKIGYLKRKTSPEDGRVQVISLNATGRKFIARHFREHERVLEEATDVLNAKERIQLERLLKKWGRSLQPEE
ncbi:MAG: MarR family winged helix-turn-helix transcriptional regulator [Verrucomicrobiota bacterium]